MKYFKVSKGALSNLRAKRALIKTDCDKQTRRKIILLEIFNWTSGLLLIAVFFGVACLFVWSGTVVWESEVILFLKILCVILDGIIGFAATLFITGFLGIALSRLQEKLFKDLPEKYYRKVREKSVEVVLKKYSFGGEYIVTKCFDAYKKNFINKDVALFFCNGKLRIIFGYVNQGKYYGSIEKDIGCIEIDLKRCKVFRSEEFKEYSDEVTVIKENDKKIVLGKRAWAFLKRYL